MTSRRTNAVDIHVGRRLRTARMARRMSQEALANAVGVSFQQVQKYEKGASRIATGRLHALARFLDVPVTYFFEGAEEPSSKGLRAPGLDAITQALSTREGLRIAAVLAEIRDAALRRRIAELLEAIIKRESGGIRSKGDF